jgi:hypothetical protein
MTWKTGEIRLELNRAGVRDLLLSPEVAVDIERRAGQVTEQANRRYAEIDVGARDAGQTEPGSPARVKAKTVMGKGKNRTRARVVAEHPAARAIEAKHRVLGQSMDAAR